MNCKIAKQVKITDYMSWLGYSDCNTKNGQLIFKSPLRNENTGSFFVSPEKNIWIDFGSTDQKKGGNLIDLVILKNNCDVKTALAIIANIPQNKSSFFLSQQNSYKTEIKLKNMQPVQNAALIQYLQSRKISKATAQRYLKEVYYKNKPEQKTPYFALAFKNDKNGYEIRNKYFKGASSPKTITTIKAKTDTGILNVFEGFFDFLSALEYYKLKTPNHKTIILNSISFIESIYIELIYARKINLFLDNDNAGRNASNTIQQEHHKAINQSNILYPEHKDFNNFLTNKQ